MDETVTTKLVSHSESKVGSNDAVNETRLPPEPKSIEIRYLKPG